MMTQHKAPRELRSITIVYLEVIEIELKRFIVENFSGNLKKDIQKC